MVDELKKRLTALREAAPCLNAVADEANRIIREVEKSLEGIGVSATSGWFSSRRTREQDYENGGYTEEEVYRFLAYGRVDGEYAIHVLEVTCREREHLGQFNEPVDSNRIP
jgi:hypothetical protein